jgi:uncharacterized membrane protein YvlD (DUF360 family)
VGDDAPNVPTGPRLSLRIGFMLLVDAGALLLLDPIHPGFEVDGLFDALIVAALAGLLNALVWPLIARYTVALQTVTLGFAALVVNGAFVTAAAAVAPGTHIRGIGTGIFLAIWVTTLGAIVQSVLAIEDDDTWYRNVVKRQLRRQGKAESSDVPGLLFLEIDGLAHDVLRRAIRDGNAPTLGRWLRDTHRMEQWETDWSSQTGACQAGLLHGSNHDMPAFRWWEKDRGAAIVTNHPRDAEELERRRSNGKGLLHAGGASRANILSGDADHTMLTMSTVLRRRRPIGRDYAAYFLRPYAVVRTFILAVADIYRERRAAAEQRRRDVQPRIHRSRVYALVRAYATVVQRDLQVAAVIADVLAGRPVVYTTFLAYDEVAHHSGVERRDTLEVLSRVDRQIARIDAARADAPRPYEIVVLSDHGQSQGATFLQRYNVTLEQLVMSAAGARTVQAAAGGEDEALGFLSAGLTELARDDTRTARAVRGATRRQTTDGTVALGVEKRAEIESTRERDIGVPELSVMASGCLGLVSFPNEPGRVTLERLEELCPQLIPSLAGHPGIAFVLVRSEADGPVVIGTRGLRFLDGDRVVGEDPLAPFGPNAADHVRRTDGFPHCPDILVNSTYWGDSDEVAAFEELVGSHGGMGGGQSFPFVLFPREFAFPEKPVVGAEHMHQVMRGWLAGLGHESYNSVDSPGSSTRTSTPGAASPA